MEFVSINPATGKKIRSFRPASATDIDRALTRAHRAYLAWRETPVSGRVKVLRGLDRAIATRLADLAPLATAEMGKPIVQARAELEKCRTLCSYYARHAADILKPERPAGAPANAHVQFEPIGVILAVMPWNFPFWQALRAAVPTLAAGNAMILKHAPNVSGCALEIEKLFEAAGAPAGLFQTLLLPVKHVPAVIADRRVQAVTLTGSNRAGSTVGALAGAAVKKAVFELGGSDAYLVLADADLDKAAEICAASRLINSGQSCVCAKRFIVDRKVLPAFQEKFLARVSARTVGDPTRDTTQVGPIARADLRDHLDQQVQASVKRGARAVLGGHPIPGRGFYYAPTVLTGVKPGMPAYEEELFGPVAAIIAVSGEDAAIAAANSSRFGLGSAVFTRSAARAKRVAARLDAGQVAINDFVRSDPSLPFGGVKESGHGRELGAYGLREFTNIKTVCGTA